MAVRLMVTGNGSKSHGNSDKEGKGGKRDGGGNEEGNVDSSKSYGNGNKEGKDKGGKTEIMVAKWARARARGARGIVPGKKRARAMTARGMATATLLSSLGNRTVAGSNRSDISSASFGIHFFYCQKYDIPVPL